MKGLSEAPPDVQTVAQLILGTGQRPNAAITMRRDQFSGEWMTVIDEKGNQHLEVYCPPYLHNAMSRTPHVARILARTCGNPKRATLRSSRGSGHGVPLLEICQASRAPRPPPARRLSGWRKPGAPPAQLRRSQVRSGSRCHPIAQHARRKILSVRDRRIENINRRPRPCDTPV